MTTILNNQITFQEPTYEFNEVLANTATRLLSVFSIGVESVESEPPSPASIDSYYIVAPEATEAWAGKDGQIAIPAIGADNLPVLDGWAYFQPAVGYKVFVKDLETDLIWDGSEWVVPECLLVRWGEILELPDTFPPDPHTHEIADIVGLQEALDLLQAQIDLLQ